jgi:hypothetical protein
MNYSPSAFARLSNDELDILAVRTDTRGPRIVSQRASDIEPERLEWVWPGRIAKGKLVLIGGPPGLGKSQLTAFVSATISTGGAWPCGEGHAPRGSVLFLSAEDGIADTIVPRLMAAGADRSRVEIIEAVTNPDGKGRKTFSLKTDVALLEAKAKTMGDVRLIVIDPISAYMGGADGNGNVATREALEPIASMANRLGIAVLAVTHLNKGGDGQQNALNRFAGSIAFVAAARSAFAVIEDSEDKTRRLLLQAKNNLSPKCDGLAFRIEQREVADGILSSNVVFEDEHVDRSIDEALSASEGRGGTGDSGGGLAHEAAEFLKIALAAGPADVLKIESEARAAGLLAEGKPVSQSKPFRSARKMLNVQLEKVGFMSGAKWRWRLPGVTNMPSGNEDAPLHSRAPSEAEGIFGDDGSWE